MRNEVLTRDDFVALLFAADFFQLNPAFAPVWDAVNSCRAAYQESAAKNTCGCGGNTQLIFGCLDDTLALMERLRTENAAALAVLLAYVSEKRDRPEITSFTLYYRKTGQEPLLKVKFP
jgi:hypothetical protein